MTFVDQHREPILGVEPICTELPIAPSSVLRTQGTCGQSGLRLPARHRSGMQRWRSRSAGCGKKTSVSMVPARCGDNSTANTYSGSLSCTVERLMKKLGIQGVRRGKGYKTTIADDLHCAACRPGSTGVYCHPPQPAVGCRH